MPEFIRLGGEYYISAKSSRADVPRLCSSTAMRSRYSTTEFADGMRWSTGPLAALRNRFSPCTTTPSHGINPPPLWSLSIDGGRISSIEPRVELPLELLVSPEPLRVDVRDPFGGIGVTEEVDPLAELLGHLEESLACASRGSGSAPASWG